MWETNFWSLQQTVLSKTDTSTLSENKIIDLFPDFQFFGKGFRMCLIDRTKNERGLLLYVNDYLPGIINKFKESSEMILLAYQVKSCNYWVIRDPFYKIISHLYTH